jgi:hypothetical protein
MQTQVQKPSLFKKIVLIVAIIAAVAIVIATLLWFIYALR